MSTRGLHRLAVLTAGATLFLIFAGGLVTSTGSGLAVPDWPLSYGQVFPPMVGGVFYEHGHRMVAAGVGLLMTALAVWIFARERRRWVGWLAATALGAVVLQGILGGITVLFLLPTAVSVTHACLAQAFFCLTVALAVVTGRRWVEMADRPIASPGALRPLTAGLTAAIYGQLVLGALMRHTGAGLAIPDFPLSFGRLIPPLVSAPVIIHFSHRIGAIVVAGLVAAVAWHVLRAHRDRHDLVRPVAVIGALAAIQIALGATTIWTLKAVTPTTLHVATGAALLAASLVLTLRAFRLTRVPAGRRGGAAVSDYLALAKPRVVMMILLVTLVGFILGSDRGFDAIRLINTLIGTALVAGGTLALNQYLERDLDALMNRTMRRPLPGGRMRAEEALLFGGALTTGGLIWLSALAGTLAGLVTALTVIGYLFLYTPLKTRTALCTVMGAFPGALPPVTGYVAARGAFGPGAVLLFGILFFWQLPHSLAIAWIYRDDYRRAGIRMLPTAGPRGSTGRHALLNSIALLLVGALPTAIGLAGWAYFAGAAALGATMLLFSALLAADPTAARARHLLLASYAYVPIVMLLMAVDRVGP